MITSDASVKLDFVSSDNKFLADGNSGDRKKNAVSFTIVQFFR